MVKAVDIDGNRLVLTDIEIPSPGPSEIRIDIKATAVNRADLSQRGGNYAPPPGSSHIMGLECAGIVDSVGDNVSLVSPGDKVCALLPGGGYAESVIVPAGQVLPIPRGLSFVEAAAIPEVFATAYLNIFMEAAAQPGESVLLHAGASGVGTAAIQMCSAFGNTCYVTAGNEQKIERCRELGAAAGCNRHREDFVASVKDWTDGQGVDVILDPGRWQLLSRQHPGVNQRRSIGCDWAYGRSYRRGFARRYDDEAFANYWFDLARAFDRRQNRRHGRFA